MKRKTKKNFVAALIMLSSAFCASSGQILWKKSSHLISTISIRSIVNLFLNLYFIIGVVFYGLGFILMIVALKKGELSRLHALYGFGFIWGLFLAHLVFHEIITILNILGVFLIIIGGYFITKE